MIPGEGSPLATPSLQNGAGGRPHRLSIGIEPVSGVQGPLGQGSRFCDTVPCAMRSEQFQVSGSCGRIPKGL